MNKARNAFSVSAGVLLVGDCLNYTCTGAWLQGGMAKLRVEFAGLGKGLGFCLDFSRFFTRLKMNDLEAKEALTCQRNKRMFLQPVKYQQDTNTKKARTFNFCGKRGKIKVAL